MENSEEGRVAFRFRLYPTERQERKMNAVLETCRVLWNDALEQRNERWSC
ncbi:MAG: helix-turn-helix domain-containing protein [Nitrososphaerota archaeon]|nr:helix-turn-helix domain-containing protein [Nitrososphaerota archaeon]